MSDYHLKWAKCIWCKIITSFLYIWEVDNEGRETVESKIYEVQEIEEKKDSSVNQPTVS